jgi:hypothetical protein
MHSISISCIYINKYQLNFKHKLHVKNCIPFITLSAWLKKSMSHIYLETACVSDHLVGPRMVVYSLQIAQTGLFNPEHCQPNLKHTFVRCRDTGSLWLSEEPFSRCWGCCPWNAKESNLVASESDVGVRFGMDSRERGQNKTANE